MPQTQQTTQTTTTPTKSQDASARFGEYLNQVFESTFYKKGDANIQRSVREKIYEQKMKPFYAKYDLPLPDKTYFVTGSNADIKKKEPSYANDFANAYLKESVKSGKEDIKGIPSTIRELGASYAGEVAKTGSKIISALDKAGSYVSKKVLTAATPLAEQEQFRKAWDIAAGVVPNKTAENLTYTGMRADEIVAENHVDDLKHSVARGAGILSEKVGEFEAVRNPLEQAGIAIGEFKYLSGLTQVLQNSQRGRLGLHILSNAVASYSTDKLEGTSDKEALKGAAKFIIWDAATHLRGTGKFIKGFFGRVASVGGRPLVEEVIKGMDAETPPPDKVGTALIKTSVDLRDKIAQEMFGKNYKDIPAIKDKGKVNKAFAAAAAQAPASKAAVNKTAVKMQVIKALDTHKAASPQFRELAAQLEEANPRKTEDVVTSEQIARKDAKGTAKNALLLTTSGKAQIDDLAKSVGAAGVRDPAFLNALADIARAGVPEDIKKIEGHRNKIAFLWTVRKELPSYVVKEVVLRMKEFYPGVSTREWDGIAKKFETHVSQMRATGHVNPKDTRGVFRSTQLATKPTKWQEQLAIEAEVIKLKKQTKRKDVQTMLDSLNRALRKKNPDIEKMGAKLDEIRAKQKELAKKPLKGIDKIRAATPNATGTRAEAAVEKALSKLDTKRTKEQAAMLKKFNKRGK